MSRIVNIFSPEWQAEWDRRWVEAVRETETASLARRARLRKAILDATWDVTLGSKPQMLEVLRAVAYRAIGEDFHRAILGHWYLPVPDERRQTAWR